MRRRLLWGASVLALGSLLFVGAGWYYSEELLPAPQPGHQPFELSVTEVDSTQGRITIGTDDPDVADLETVGVVTETGLLLLDGVMENGADGGIERQAALLDGEWPSPGDLAAVAVDTFAGPPDATLGLPSETVAVPGEHGNLPAWRVVPRRADTDDAWVVIVHGRGGAQADGNRILPTLDDLRLPSLSVTVRNDPGAPPDPDGFGRFGEVEWEDLQAAIDHLKDVEEAERIVLVGYSQGASTSLTFLRRSPDASMVDAAILVSPLISLDATLESQARDEGVPGPLVTPLLVSTRLVSSVRADLPTDAAEHLDGLDELPDVPMLVTHGDADTTVPVEPTRRFVDQLGDQVTYEEYPGVEHVREWNADRQRFESDLRGFLDEHVLQHRD